MPLGIALLAAAAGAGLALLFAPFSGEKTRHLIRFNAASFAKDLRDEVSANAAAPYGNGAASTQRAAEAAGQGGQTSSLNQEACILRVSQARQPTKTESFRPRLQANVQSRPCSPTPRLGW